MLGQEKLAINNQYSKTGKELNYLMKQDKC